MKKKNVYDLALIKVKQELTAFEMFLKEKNNKKKELLKIFEDEEKLKKEFEKEMEEKKVISPSITYLNRLLSFDEKEKILRRIREIEQEILALKREYSRIKQRNDKIIEQKEKKEIEIKRMKTKKEMKLIQNDYVSKRFLE